MKNNPPWIAVDWGTSHMRAWLIEDSLPDIAAFERLDGPGVAGLSKPPEAVLLELLTPWTDVHGQLDIVAAGMVGSNLGWRPVPYLTCPVDLSSLGQHLFTFEDADHQVAIVPGVSCINSFGQPDVMRGEETQVLGWWQRHKPADDDQRLLCLPGTHSKWVEVSGHTVQRFGTAMTGELYELLRTRSVLVQTPDAAFDETAFMQGVEVACKNEGELLNLLFSTRARGLITPGQQGDPASYLSGLLIASDVSAGISPSQPKLVDLVGALPLCEKYALVLDYLGIQHQTLEGDTAVLKGLQLIKEIQRGS